MLHWKQWLMMFAVAVVVGAAAYYFGRQHSEVKFLPPPQKPVSVESKPRTDTAAAPVVVVKKVTDSTAIRRLLRENDSLRALHGDTVFVEKYLSPFSFVVEDKFTRNFGTVTPMNPEGTRVRLDSTQYKQFTLSGTTEIKREDCDQFIPKWYEHTETQIAGALVLILLIAK